MAVYILWEYRVVHRSSELHLYDQNNQTFYDPEILPVSSP